MGGIKHKTLCLQHFIYIRSLPSGNETARPFYGGMTYILDNYKHNQLQVTNIVSFPFCLISSRTYSINARTLSGYYPKSGYSRTIWPTSEASLFPNYPAMIRSRASPGLSDRLPKPGYSRTIRQLSEAGLFPDYPATIRSRASPGLSDWYPKLGCPRTIRQLSEVALLPDYPTTIRVELPLTPETAHGLLYTKTKTYIF